MEIVWNKKHQYAVEASVGALHFVIEKEDDHDYRLWLAFAEEKPPEGEAWNEVMWFPSMSEGKRSVAKLLAQTIGATPSHGGSCE